MDGGTWGDTGEDDGGIANPGGPGPPPEQHGQPGESGTRPGKRTRLRIT